MQNVVVWSYIWQFTHCGIVRFAFGGSNFTLVFNQEDCVFVHLSLSVIVCGFIRLFFGVECSKLTMLFVVMYVYLCKCSLVRSQYVCLFFVTELGGFDARTLNLTRRLGLGTLHTFLLTCTSRSLVGRSVWRVQQT